MMKNYSIRRFRDSDAAEVSEVIIKTIRISNTKDYPEDLMEELIKMETPDKVSGRASWTHTYVVEDDGRIIATGAVGPYWGSLNESSLFTVFVLPEYQGKGVGRMIVNTLEQDEYALRAKRIEIPASVTGLPFYKKMGYDFKDGNDQIDEEHLYRLEKFKPVEALVTERLYLRNWRDSDAEAMFSYCTDPDVGPIAGWPPHKDIDESRYIIKNVLNSKEAFAICLRETDEPIGCIELKLNGKSDIAFHDDECEMGYWLGKPYWGQGIMPEAGKELVRHGFEDLGMKKIWCGYFDGNNKSKRAQEKIGFKYQWTSEDVDVPLMNETRRGFVSLITIDDYRKEKENEQSAE